MKKFLILVLLVLAGCVEPFNEEEFIKSLPVTECTNPICNNMDIIENISETHIHYHTIINSKYLKKYPQKPNNKYILNIYYIYDDCGLMYPPKCKITKVEAILRTKEGIVIKQYKIENTSNIKGACGTLLHAETNKEKVYVIATLEYLRSALYQQINADNNLYRDVEKIIKSQEKKLNKLKKMLKIDSGDFYDENGPILLQI